MIKLVRSSSGSRVALLALVLAMCAHQGRGAVQQPPGAEQRSEMLGQATQLVLVTTANWEAVEGELQLYERSTPKARWRSVGNRVPVVVGRNGMGWGTGLQGEATVAGGQSEPTKKEGDGKAPAGVFKLSSVFGYAAPDAVRRLKMPYVQATSTLECVDDIHSYYYNRIVDRSRVSVDWQSAEEMRRPDDEYKWGVFVDHNSDPAVSGLGSCIFLHVWAGPGIGTVGCTAMPEANVREISFWLDPKKRPLLAQVPKTHLGRYKARWGLPDE